MTQGLCKIAHGKDSPGKNLDKGAGPFHGFGSAFPKGVGVEALWPEIIALSSVAVVITALDVLAGRPGVKYAGRLGDHLQAMTAPEAHTAVSLQAARLAAGLTAADIEPVDVTFEDVFIELAGRLQVK